MKYHRIFLACLLCVGAICRVSAKYFAYDLELNDVGGKIDLNERTSEFWRSAAQSQLRVHLQRQINSNTAKNVIFFMGDGMSLSTITAARIYKGQQMGQRGEEGHLSFEKFPHTGIMKTYCVDCQTADSSVAATALFSGIAGNILTTGVNGQVRHHDCQAAANVTNQVETLFTWAQKAGKRTGLVTNTRITHATPGAAYAHSSSRNFECDADLVSLNAFSPHCRDIAKQLVYDAPGRDINVIFGAGRAKLLPKEECDEDGNQGERLDGVNLIDEWLVQHPQGVYVHNKTGLDGLTHNDTVDRVLGLFASDHIDYWLDADHGKVPSLKDMTVAALKILNKHAKGYFLFVEGGSIDLAHHDALAAKALEETVQFADAVQAAVDLTNEKDTLIVVTADHSHLMTISGWSTRGNNILGLADSYTGSDDLPYSTLSYANGPGAKLHMHEDGTRVDLTGKVLDKDYKYTSAVPLQDVNHSGEDVVLFAKGPQSHLFTGVYHQTTLAHLISYSSCIGHELTKCTDDKQSTERF